MVFFIKVNFYLCQINLKVTKPSINVMKANKNGMGNIYKFFTSIFFFKDL